MPTSVPSPVYSPPHEQPQQSKHMTVGPDRELLAIWLILRLRANQIVDPGHENAPVKRKTHFKFYKILCLLGSVCIIKRCFSNYISLQLEIQEPSAPPTGFVVPSSTLTHLPPQLRQQPVALQLHSKLVSILMKENLW